MPKARVLPMPAREALPVETVAPWKALGFESERDMLLDDLKVLDRRIKSDTTTATAVAALSKRKQEVFEQIKHLDSGDDEFAEILDDADDEAWNVGG